jgi:hypothetical protein
VSARVATSLASGVATGRAREPATREHLRITIGNLSLVPTLWLAWVVIHREPLPLEGVRSAALTTTVFCLGVIGIVLYVQRLELLSFPVLFLGVTFLFTCSPLILYQFQGSQAFSSWEFVDIPAILLSMPVVMLAFSSFLSGSMLVRAPRERDEPHRISSDEAPEPRVRALRNLAIAMYAISALLIIGFTLGGSALTLAFEGGHQGFHGAKRVGQLSQLVGVSMSRLLPWSLLILAATSRSRRSRIAAVVLFVPFVVVMFSTGDRGNALAATATIASGLYLVGARVGWRRTLVLVAVIAFLIPTVLNLRRVPISQWTPQAFTAAATNDINGTPAYGQTLVGGFLVSMSSSFQTLMATVKVVPLETPYHYGSDYLSSTIVAIPFRSIFLPAIGVTVRDLPPSQWVLQYLHPGRTAGPGYLQLAEAYLQFGAIGVVGLYLLLGWGLMRLWRFVSSHRWNAQTLAFGLIAMSEMLIWIRNSSSLEARALSWGWLIVYVVPLLLARRRSSAPARTAHPAAERVRT